MKALIVGGDRVNSLKQQITANGYAEIKHWSGRKKKYCDYIISGHTQLIVMVYDYISHSLAIAVKNKANRLGIPLIYCRNSSSDIKHKLLSKEGSNDYCDCCCSYFNWSLLLGSQVA